MHLGETHLFRPKLHLFRAGTHRFLANSPVFRAVIRMGRVNTCGIAGRLGVYRLAIHVRFRKFRMRFGRKEVGTANSHRFRAGPHMRIRRAAYGMPANAGKFRRDPCALRYDASAFGLNWPAAARFPCASSRAADAIRAHADATRRVAPAFRDFPHAMLRFPYPTRRGGAPPSVNGAARKQWLGEERYRIAFERSAIVPASRKLPDTL